MDRFQRDALLNRESGLTILSLSPRSIVTILEPMTSQELLFCQVICLSTEYSVSPYDALSLRPTIWAYQMYLPWVGDW